MSTGTLPTVSLVLHWSICDEVIRSEGLPVYTFLSLLASYVTSIVKSQIYQQELLRALPQELGVRYLQGKFCVCSNMEACQACKSFCRSHSDCRTSL